MEEQEQQETLTAIAEELRKLRLSVTTLLKKDPYALMTEEEALFMTGRSREDYLQMSPDKVSVFTKSDGTKSFVIAKRYIADVQ